MTFHASVMRQTKVDRHRASVSAMRRRSVVGMPCGEKPRKTAVERWYVGKDGVTRFCCDLEITLCGGYSQEEYAEDFRRAMHLLTKNAVPDFKVSLSLYYLEHDADLEVEYDRQELAGFCLTRSPL